MKKHVVIALLSTAAVTAILAQSKEPLANLIQQGNSKAALEKIKAGANVNEAQPDGTRPIHWAVFKVDYDLLQALIAKKADVNTPNEFGSTPLAEAVKLADAKMVKMLLDAGAKPDAANLDGETALMLAIKGGDLSNVEQLLAKGANVNVIEKFHNQTPLMYAASAPRNAAQMVKMLLAKGADPKPRSLFRDWDSQISSEPRGQYRPTGGHTALLLAARDGCLDCIEPLLAAGANINTPTPEAVTPLMLALDNSHNEIAKLLLQKGANPNVWDWWGRTALYIAVDRKEAVGARGPASPGAAKGKGPPPAAPGVSSMELITMLLDAGVDPNAELNFHRPSRGGNSGRFGETSLSTGATPLFRAVQGNDLQVIQALLAKGANPNINAMGDTPFTLAATAGPGGRGGNGGGTNTAILDLLTQHDADVNAKVTGTKSYSMRIMYRAPANAALEGMTSLHVAAQQGNIEMVRYLLSKGADPNVLDSKGKKPIDLAVSAPPAPAQAKGNAQAKGVPGAGRGGPSPQTLAEIRALLEAATQQKNTR